MTRLDLYQLTRAELGATLAQWGHKPVHADAIWRQLYLRCAETVADIGEVPDGLQRTLAERAGFPVARAVATTHDGDHLARKELLELADGERVETVLMRYAGRVTACVSSQVGCAMGCVFCASGQMGFRRHLRAAEIVAQVVHLQRLLGHPGPSAPLARRDHPSVHHRHERLRNVVFMGMGEPLHNLDEVLRAIEILRDPGGLCIAARRITVSTVGVVPGIRRLTELGHPVNLAVSLHGATQDQRHRLVRVAARWPLDEIVAACRDYTEALSRRVFFEWTLIDGENDGDDQAHALGELLRDMRCQVNLIPLNPTPGCAMGASDRARSFQRVLGACGIPSTVRQRRGTAIAAGCGQLAVAPR